MIANAIFATTLIFLGLGILFLQECRFLIPYRGLLLGRYAHVIAAFAATLFVNLFAAVYMFCRVFLLKDTGRKLAHLEKQLRTGTSLSDELTRRLND